MIDEINLKKEICIFSGLGADERVFQKLDLSNYFINYIEWIEPQKNENLSNYVSRLLLQIKTSKPLLIGLSFGGIIAVEMAKFIETEKIILISSAKTKNEIPFYYQILGKLGIHKLLPIKLMKKSNLITNWFFGVKTTFEKNLLKEILRDTNPIFLKWAIEKIVRWDNIKVPQNIFHIHGAKDKILPINFVKYNIKINKGGHFMILNQADLINNILKQQLI